MTKVEVRNMDNEVVGAVDVGGDILNSEVKPALIHEVVVMQLACRRAGTHSTKTKGKVSGGGRKPWKQKGSGRARSGSSRSPLWRGGGIIFGPLPRDYSYTMPKKKVKAALKSVLSSKYADDRVCVIDAFDIKDGKTKEAVAVMKKFGVNRGALFIVDNFDDNDKAFRAFRNLPYVNFLHVAGLNVYDVVNAHKIFILKNCLPQIEKVLLTAGGKTA
ncbi:MAG: 50S ribosomal protein L4 [Deferribacteraceae bacterium]|jgi:large subunit ribosomal protein L4|nr:50S ribosomal protein L4 [Deferribacteraceae bacterium]